MAPGCPHIEDMSERDEAVRRAVDHWPGSIRALAQEAGISDRLLRMIYEGKRSATPATVRGLAAALERFGRRVEEARNALEVTDPESGGEHG